MFFACGHAVKHCNRLKKQNKGQRCRWTAAAGARHARLKPAAASNPSLAGRDVHVCQLRDREPRLQAGSQPGGRHAGRRATKKKAVYSDETGVGVELNLFRIRTTDIAG